MVRDAVAAIVGALLVDRLPAEGRRARARGLELDFASATPVATSTRAPEPEKPLTGHASRREGTILPSSTVQKSTARLARGRSRALHVRQPGRRLLKGSHATMARLEDEGPVLIRGWRPPPIRRGRASLGGVSPDGRARHLAGPRPSTATIAARDALRIRESPGNSATGGWTASRRRRKRTSRTRRSPCASRAGSWPPRRRVQMASRGTRG